MKFHLFFCLLLLVSVNCGSDPIFHDANSIQTFIKGIGEGFGIKLLDSELSNITYDQFKLDDFMRSLDYQGLSALLPEKEQQGIDLIAKTMRDFQLTNKNPKLNLLIDRTLAVFGNFSKYTELKKAYNTVYPDNEISYFLWDGIDFIAIQNGFILSGKIIAKVVNILSEFL